MYALEYFPEGPDQFYDELVWAFHSIPGGESLPWDGEYEYKHKLQKMMVLKCHHSMQLKVFFGSCLGLDFNSVFTRVLLGVQVCYPTRHTKSYIINVPISPLISSPHIDWE